MSSFAGAAIHGERRRQHGRRVRSHLGSSLALVALSLVGAAALTYVGYLLWPRWPAAETAADVPSVPVTVAGVSFNVPPAAIRVPLQRRPGAQPRLDLAFRWPDLTPPVPPEKHAPGVEQKPAEHLFISIVAAEGMLPLDERIKTIYPRYIAERAFEGPDGLTGVAFREGTPYQGEDLFYLPGRTETFFARCSRDAALTPGSCLLERRVGEAMLTARFPRDWLNDWQAVAASLDRLMASMRGGAG